MIRPFDLQPAVVVFDASTGTTSDIFRMNAGGGELQNLTRSSADDQFAAWSPDGDRILYTSDAGGDNYDIWIMNSDGSGKKPFTDAPGDDFQAAWTETPG